MNGKIIAGVLVGATLLGGGAGIGTQIAQSAVDKKVEEARTEAKEEGYQEGLTVNVGYTEEELEAAVSAARAEASQQNNVNYIDFSSVGATSVTKAYELNSGDWLFTFKDVSGIWKYHKSTNKFENIYDTGLYYKFLGVGRYNEGIYFCPSDSTVCGLVLYENEKITELFGFGTSWKICKVTSTLLAFQCTDSESERYFLRSNGTTSEVDLSSISDISITKITELQHGCLISSLNTESGLLYLDFTDLSITQVCSDGYSFETVVSSNGVLSCSFYKSSAGIVSFDEDSKTVTTIKESVYNYTFIETTNGYLYGTRSSSTPGLYYIDKTSLEETTLLTTGYSWSFNECNSANISISSTSSDFGWYVFNDDTSTLTKISDGYSFSSFSISGETLFTGSKNGVYLWDEDTQSMTQIYSEGGYWECVCDVNGTILITSQSSTAGILKFDAETKTFQKICDDGYWLNSYVDVGNGYLLSCDKDEGTCFTGAIWVSKDFTSAKKIYDKGRCWTEIKSVDDSNYLVFTTSISSGGVYFGVCIYSQTDGTMSQLLSYCGGYKYTTFTEKEGVTYLNWTKNGTTYNYYYDTSSMTLKLVNYSGYTID